MKFTAALRITTFAMMLPTQALADCDITDTLLKQAYPMAEQAADGLAVKSGGYAQVINPDNVVCKAWPYRPELTLAAIPIVEARPPAEGENKGDVEIIVFDRTIGKILARRLETGMAFSDAIRFSSLELDTARYDVSSELRAFGLRTSQYGSSRVNPYDEHALWLYTFNNGGIERVLDGLIVERTNGENDGDCSGSSTTIKRTLTIVPKKEPGYRELRVEQTVMHETSTKTAAECHSSNRFDQPVHFSLAYRDGRYRPVAGVNVGSGNGDVDDDLFSSITVGAGKP